MLIEFSGKTPRIGKGSFIAPNAVIIGDVSIGDECNIWFGAVIRGDYGPIRIGSGCSIQDNAVVHVNHNQRGDVFATAIDDGCVIGHGAVVEGCHVAAGCLIGMNAVVLPRADIGPGCVVAAGSVVREGDRVPAHSLVAGAPAVVKRIDTGMSDGTAWAAGEYRALGVSYRAEAAISEEQAKGRVE